jgi:hypothetical protein
MTGRHFVLLLQNGCKELSLFTTLKWAAQQKTIFPMHWITYSFIVFCSFKIQNSGIRPSPMPCTVHHIDSKMSRVLESKDLRSHLTHVLKVKACQKTFGNYLFTVFDVL